MGSKKFPPTLNTKDKGIKKARALVEQKLGVQTRKGELSGFQGMWSETYIVSLKDHRKSKIVVQSRSESLDIAPFNRARELLGEYVPSAELLHDEELQTAGFWPVCMPCIPGKAWAEVFNRSDTKFNVMAMKSLGKLLARCVLDESSANPIQ